MLSAGDWLDRSSATILTLGGHHTVVLYLAVAGFVILGVLAVLTNGLVLQRQLRRVVGC